MTPHRGTERHESGVETDATDHTDRDEDREHAAHDAESGPRTLDLYLPPDDEHPPRLDVPIWRHLTYDEAHAAELGLVGALAAFAFVEGSAYVQAVVIGAAALTFKVALFDLPNQSPAGRLLGSESWYFVTVFVVSALVTGVLVS